MNIIRRKEDWALCYDSLSDPLRLLFAAGKRVGIGMSGNRLRGMMHETNTWNEN